MCPGSLFSPLSALGVPSQVYTPGGEATELAIPSEFRLPLIIEPNWQLDENEILIFQGYPIVDDPIVLEISVHVWEFPDWEGC
jgi:hypothetical protein